MDFGFTLKVTFLHLLFISEFIVSKKLSAQNLGGINSVKINECQRCNVLVESFNHGLQKTARGKFEGGDANWEETKLKSYARSEIRLVEIQEGLCSEVNKHQDHCYSLAEEAEQALEKWWFHENPKTVDLYTWLCIETLQHCCPLNHYGDSCETCPLDKHNEVCGGQGKCDGEGTRKGTGACICNKGFTGKLCTDCDRNFYDTGMNQCEPCHKACDGCFGQGSAACHSCKPGWKLESDSCLDIDECLSASTCKPNQYCINKEGSHICKPCDKSCETCSGFGEYNCTSCEPNCVLWSGMCVNNILKSELLSDALKRIALYFGLFIITLFVCRKSRILASMVVLVIAVYVYFLEKTSRMNIIELSLNIYLR